MSISSTPVFMKVTIRKVRLLWAFAILGGAAGALLVAGRAHAEHLGFSVSAAPAPGAGAGDLSISVLDDRTGAAVSDAAILVADSLLDTSNALRGQTGAQGTFVARGTLLNGPRTLVVSKSGYSSISVAGLRSAQIQVHLKPLPLDLELSSTVLASGNMSSWPALSSNTVTAGIVFKSLSAVDLLHFSTESFISPLKDTIQLLGSHEVPSNFLMPDQDVLVLFAPVHLGKPKFRLPVTRGKPIQLAGIQGAVSIKELVALAQGGGKMSVGLLNKLTFSRAGLTAPLATDRDFNVSIQAGHRLSPRHSVTPSLPPFKADVIVAAATDMDGTRDLLMPSDVKVAAEAAKPGQIRTVKLSATEDSVGAARDVLTVAVSEDHRRTSGIVTDRAGATVAPGRYLDVLAISDAPELPESVVIPAVTSGLGAAVYEDHGAALLYVYAMPGSATTIPSRLLPPTAKITSYSVINLDFGPGFDPATFEGHKVMTRLQRFARSKAAIGQQSGL